MSSITLGRVSESFQYRVGLESEQSADPQGGNTAVLGHLLDERMVASEQRAHISAIQQRSRLFGDAGAWEQCAPASPVRCGRPAPQLHRYTCA